jgi:phosphoribosylanthranilate isomerase
MVGAEGMAQRVIPRVKICGITSVEDGLHAARCGADALGLVFYAKSPRCVTAEQARRIVAALPPLVTTVGLFVNQPAQEITDIARFCGLDVLQLHGDETPEQCQLPPWRVIKALRVRDEQSLADFAAYRVNGMLLDAWQADSYGGTGHSFNWKLAVQAAQQRQIILAGGLTPANVAEAVKTVRPYAVDVSSGVESAPGCKDPDLVAAFIRNAKHFTE